MDQLAAQAFPAERRPHIKSLHLARLRVDSSQRTASCNLLVIFIVERQKQASPWTCILAGKLCQFFRESLEAKANSHRLGVFNKKFAHYADELWRCCLFDVHDGAPPLFVMLPNSPVNVNATPAQHWPRKETIWLALLLPFSRASPGTGSLHSDALDLEMRAKKQRPRADKRARRKIMREICAVNRIELLEQRDVRAKHLHKNKILHRERRAGKGAAKTIEHEANFPFDIGGNFLRRRIQAQVAAHVERIANQHAIRKRQRAESRGRRKVNALGSRWHGWSPMN